MRKIQQKSIVLAIFMTVISQTPYLRESLKINTQILILPFWILSLAIAFIRDSSINIGKTKLLYCLYIIIITFFILLEVITQRIYIQALFSLSIYISFLMLIIGDKSGFLYKYEDFNFDELSRAYIVSAIILGIDIFTKYFINYSFNTMTYLYKPKNSAGQIFLTAVVLLFFQIKNKPWKIYKIMMIIFFIMMIVLMRSRATLISIIFIPLVFIVNKSIQKKYKIFIVVITLLFVLAFLLNNKLYDLVINNVIFHNLNSNGYENINLDKLSSNRFSIIANRIDMLKGKEFWGVGSAFYVDNFFVNAIVHYGYIAGFFVITVAIWPIIVLIKLKYYYDVSIQVKMIFQMLTLIYLFNSLFEGWAPFGPGAKCFFLWFLLGIIMSSSKRHEILNLESING